MSIQNQEKERKENEAYSSHFARIPNMLFASFHYLSKEEKFLYCTLKSIYWDAKPRSVSLRELSELTGYAAATLCKMLPRLHTCGLIHAEVRREKGRDGKAKGKAKYAITILDIWELNQAFYACPHDQRDALDPSLSLFTKTNKVEGEFVHENEQVCSPNDTTSFTKQNNVVHENEQSRALNKPAKPSHGTSKDVSKKNLSQDREKERASLSPSVKSSSSGQSAGGGHQRGAGLQDPQQPKAKSPVKPMQPPENAKEAVTLSLEEQREANLKRYAELVEQARRENNVLLPPTSSRVLQEQPPKNVKEVPRLSVDEQREDTTLPTSNRALQEQPHENVKEVLKLSVAEQCEHTAPPPTRSRALQEQPPKNAKEALSASIAEHRKNTVLPPTSNQALQEPAPKNVKEATRLSVVEQREVNLKRYAELLEQAKKDRGEVA